MRTVTHLLLVTCLLGVLSACRGIDGPETASNGTPSVVENTSDPQGTAPVVASGTAATPEVGTGTAAVSEDAAASVNGAVISLADFRSLALDTQRVYVERGLDPNSAEGQQELLRLRRQVLDDMINQVLLEQAAVELGITVSEAEVDEAVRNSVQALGGQASFEESLTRNGLTEEDVRTMEQAGILGAKVQEAITGALPTTAEAVHARHILCETEEACQAARDRITSGEDFGAVASNVSTDTATATRAGDLDWVIRGLLPSRQVEEILFSLPVGQVSTVVQTDFGYHVIEILETNSALVLNEEQVAALRQQAFLDWLEERRKGASIEIYVEDLRDLSAHATG